MKLNIILNQDNGFIGIDENGETVLNFGFLYNDNPDDINSWTIIFNVDKVRHEYSKVVDNWQDYKELLEKLLVVEINKVINYPY